MLQHFLWILRQRWYVLLWHLIWNLVQMSPYIDEVEYMNNVPYTSVIGSWMYVMVCSRLYISHVVSMVSRYMHNLGKRHWQEIKRILRYILGIVDVGRVLFQQGSSTQAMGFLDWDYKGDLDKSGRSTISYVCTLAGEPICWRSTSQSIVDLFKKENIWQWQKLSRKLFSCMVWLRNWDSNKIIF